MAQYSWPTQSITTSNLSVGTTGTTAPTSATEVGGIGADGNLHGLSTDNSGQLNVNVASSTLPTGAATAANQTNGSQKTQVVDASGNVQPAGDTAGRALFEKVTDGTNTLSISAAGAAKVDGSAVTQPISASALPLPAGAATAAKQPALGTAGTPSSDVISVQGVTSMTPLKVDGSGATQPVSGTVTANQGTGGASAWKVDGSAVVQPVSQSGTWTVQPGNTPNTTAWLVAQKGRSQANAPVYNVYATTSVTTSAYVTMVASTTSAITWLDIFDSSGQAMILATGAASSEVVLAYIPPGGLSFSVAIPASTRLSLKALTANATTGYFLMDAWG